MSKIVKSLLASAVIFSSTALPATAANINKSSEISSGEYRVSQLSNNAGELVANGANHESYYVCVRSGYLNVRNARGRVIGRVYKGQRLIVTANARSRYQIRYGRGFGWVSSSYVCYGA